MHRRVTFQEPLAERLYSGGNLRNREESSKARQGPVLKNQRISGNSTEEPLLSSHPHPRLKASVNQRWTWEYPGSLSEEIFQGAKYRWPFLWKPGGSKLLSLAHFAYRNSKETDDVRAESCLGLLLAAKFMAFTSQVHSICIRTPADLQVSSAVLSWLEWPKQPCQPPIGNWETTLSVAHKHCYLESRYIALTPPFTWELRIERRLFMFCCSPP